MIERNRDKVEIDYCESYIFSELVEIVHIKYLEYCLSFFTAVYFVVYHVHIKLSAVSYLLHRQVTVKTKRGCSAS